MTTNNNTNQNMPVENSQISQIEPTGSNVYDGQSDTYIRGDKILALLVDKIITSDSKTIEQFIPYKLSSSGTRFMGTVDHILNQKISEIEGESSAFMDDAKGRIKTLLGSYLVPTELKHNDNIVYGLVITTLYCLASLYQNTVDLLKQNNQQDGITADDLVYQLNQEFESPNNLDSIIMECSRNIATDRYKMPSDNDIKIIVDAMITVLQSTPSRGGNYGYRLDINALKRLKKLGESRNPVHRYSMQHTILNYHDSKAKASTAKPIIVTLTNINSQMPNYNFRNTGF